MSNRDYTAVMIVPTGVGAKIGGYAGDALPAAKLLSSVADVLITHPNVMNGAMLYWPKDNILYVEGHALNEFASQRIGLQPFKGKKSQKIGVILDKGIEEELMIRHIQVVEGARATLGIDIGHVVVTSKELGVKTFISEESGASWGSVSNTQTLIEAAEYLQHNHSCTAIAVIARFPEDEEIVASEEGSVSSTNAIDRFAAYRAGEGVDGIAGIEALISHIISKRTMLPCAHAPAFLPMSADKSVSPKACAEELGYTFLPCVLAYLHRTPHLIDLSPTESRPQPHNSMSSNEIIYANDVDAVVVPYNALGGPAVLEFLALKKLIIAVEENETSMQVTRDCFSAEEQRHIVIARSYAEAAGLLAAHKAGILFEALTPIVSRVPITEL